MKIITISGHARNGKDLVGLILSDTLQTRGYKVLITHYADLVKYVSKIFFRWDGKKDVVGRSILQSVGTDVARSKNENYWVDFIGDWIKHSEDIWDYVIIPDARFPNEISRLKERGFDVEVVKVICPEIENGLTEEQKNHPSELSVDEIRPDYLILNDGTIEDLEEKVWVLTPVLIGG